MRISRIEINNFRSIRHLVVDLGDTTVFIGPNNSGKTAILDAIRIALTRRWGPRGAGFSEYDVHMADDASDPKASSGVSIELKSEERKPGEWPKSIATNLEGIMQLDRETQCNSISLRVECRWSETTDSFEPTWEFLGPDHEPMTEPNVRRNILEQFSRYLPIFYLGALRDAEDEFSARSSQFWLRLLKDLNIPPEFESRALRALDQLNRELLKADPRLAKITETLSGTTRVATRDREGGLDLRMVPLKSWDLLSRTEIILRNEPDLPWLPLKRQGQGIQSLSVIFLFQAFVDHLLKELYEPGSEPVLALEEPETHLHPQAIRTLWDHTESFPGQKIITTHSPYFVQHVPLRDLRLVHMTKNGTEVRSLQSSFSEPFPDLDDLDSVIGATNGILAYERSSEVLTVHGPLEENHYRELLKCCSQDERRSELESRLRKLKERSYLCMSDGELLQLQTQAHRMRGEIFFAERWLIVEGQSDYLIVRAIAHAMDYDPDQHGVSIIDAQNNGNPATFAALARALGIPWLAVFDGDEKGKEFVRNIKKRGFREDELTDRCYIHPNGNLESQLVADGMRPELCQILVEIGILTAHKLNDEKLVACLGDQKIPYATRLAGMVCDQPGLVDRAPEAFRQAIAKLRGLM